MSKMTSLLAGEDTAPIFSFSFPGEKLGSHRRYVVSS